MQACQETVCVFVMWVALLASPTIILAETTHSGDLNVSGPYPVLGNFVIKAGNLTVQNAGDLVVQATTSENGNLSITSDGDSTKGNMTVLDGGIAEIAGVLDVTAVLQSDGEVSAWSGTVGSNLILGETGVIEMTRSLDVSENLRVSGSLTARSSSVGRNADVLPHGTLAILHTLEVSADLNADGTLSADSLTVSGNAIVSATGQIAVTDALSVTGDFETTGAVTADSVSVGGDATINGGGTLTVSQDLDVTKNLDVSGTVTAESGSVGRNTVIQDGGTLTITKDFDVSEDVTVNGTLSADSLTVSGNAIVSATGQIDVTDALSVTEDFETTGAVTADSVSVGGDATINGGGTLTVSQDLDVTKNLDVSGTVTAESGSVGGNTVIQNGGTLAITKAFDVSGDVTVNGTLSADSLTVSGNTTVSTTGQIDVTDALSVTEDFETTGAVTADSVSVGGDATINGGGTLTVAKAFNISGSLRNAGAVSADSATIGKDAIISNTGTFDINSLLSVTQNLEMAGTTTAGTLIVREHATVSVGGSLNVDEAGIIGGNLSTSGITSFGSANVGGNAIVYSTGLLSVNGFLNVGRNLETQVGATTHVRTLQMGGTIINYGHTTVSESYTNPVTRKIENAGTFNIGQDLINRGWIDGDGTIAVGRSLLCEKGSLLTGCPTLSGPNLCLNGTVNMSGNGLGTMTLSGNTRLAGTTYFDVRLSPDSGNDQIRVTGLNNITIVRNADDSRPTFYLATSSGTTPQLGERRTLIVSERSDGIVMEVQPRVLDNLSGYRFILRTDQSLNMLASSSQYCYAYVVRDASFEAIAQTTNQRSFGRYLDTVKNTDDGIDSDLADFQWIRDTIDLMTTFDDVRDAMEQLSGMIYAPLSSVCMQRQFFQYNQMANRLRRDLVVCPNNGYRVPSKTPLHFHLPQLDPNETILDQILTRGQAPQPEPSLTRGQVSGIGFGGNLDSDGNGYGGGYGGGGLQLLYGIYGTPRFQFGTFYQYGGIDYDGDMNGTATINSHDFGGYFTVHDPTNYLIFIAGGGFSTYDVKRSLNFGNDINWINRTAQGKHNGGQATLYAEYGLHFNGCLSGLNPYVGLLYMDITQNAFTETGATAANLVLEENHLASLRSLLGATWDKPLFGNPTLKVTTRLLWVHELLRQTHGQTTARLAPIPDTQFLILGPSAGRDWGIVGGGFQHFSSNNSSRFYINADVMVNGVSNIYIASAGWEYLW